METKAEKRERIIKNNRKMGVRGRSIFTLARIRMEKAVEAYKQINDKKSKWNSKKEI